MWCPNERIERSVSRGDIQDLAELSAIWIAGFLSGNQSAAPRRRRRGARRLAASVAELGGRAGSLPAKRLLVDLKPRTGLVGVQSVRGLP